MSKKKDMSGIVIGIAMLTAIGFMAAAALLMLAGCNPSQMKGFATGAAGGPTTQLPQPQLGDWRKYRIDSFQMPVQRQRDPYTRTLRSP